MYFWDIGLRVVQKIEYKLSFRPIEVLVNGEWILVN